MEAWLSPGAGSLEDLRALVERSTDPADYPFADGVDGNVVAYDGTRLAGDVLDDPSRRASFQAEVAAALLSGPGVVRVAGAFAGQTSEATDAFEALIADQRRRGLTSGDHFAAPGSNDRLWEALGKLAAQSPDVFARYYANDILAAVLTAYLGPGYQIVSDINVVNPGGRAQVPHRDYHLGFLGPDAAAAYPAHVHRLSPALTLQAAVAHVDMPVETGPTMYLPYSQHDRCGFVNVGRAEVAAYFLEHCVQPALAEGDLAVFNPAVLHAAGENRTSDVRRMANLLQVSSAFGRAMDAVDRAAICRAVYPELLEMAGNGAPEAVLRNVIAAAADGYAFPTNLDRDAPIDGLAPPSQADIVRRCLDERAAPEDLAARLDDYAWRHRS